MSIDRWLQARFGDVRDAQNDWRVDCPFCTARHGRADTKKHLYVNIKKPVAHCFRCNWSGHWIGLIMSVEGCSYPESLNYIKSPSVDISRFNRLHSKRGLVDPRHEIVQPDGFEYLSMTDNCHHIEYKTIRNYTRRRLKGITQYNVNSHCFGWIPGSNRLWILIDKGWWQGRTILNNDPKYINPPWPIGDSLWNWRALKSYDRIVICEGVFSAIHAGVNAIGLCSKSITQDQAKRIAMSPVNYITIMLDADASFDDDEFIASRLRLAGYGGGVSIHMLYDGDPCDGLDGDIVEYDFSNQVRYALGG